MKIRHLTVALLCLFVCAALVFADTLKLRDGTVLEGKVIPQGDKYWIKLSSGETRLVNKNDVVTFTPGDAKSATPATPGLTPASPGGSSSATGAFAALKSKIDHIVDVPIVGVTMWEKFIDSKPAPSHADLELAKAELKVWNDRQKDNAERVKGKWIGGEEKKKLMKQVDTLVREGSALFKEGQSAAGIKKFEEVLAIYPQSFIANFELGLYYIDRGAIGSDGRGNNAYMEKAIKSLEAAAKVLPTSAATWSNLAIGYNFKRRYADSVKVAYKAAKIHESKETVQNLINALMDAPPGMRERGTIKPIMEDCIQMASAHSLPITRGSWIYVRPTEGNTPGDGGDDPEAKGPPGAAWSGSGFFVTSDGYIITNHHVAAGDAKKPLQKDIVFRVRLDDGSEKNAEVIAIDDKSDIAIMKMKVDAPVPFLKIAADPPKQAAKALCLGYPATSMDPEQAARPTLQVSEGTVKSIHETDDEFEVWYDLNTTHGNSGGPVIDKGGRVISILTAYREVYNAVYLLGVGPHQIKDFLDRIPDKAPKVAWDAAEATGEFDGEKLTDVARKSTVFVLAIRSVESTDPNKSDSDSGGDSPDK